MVDVVSKLKKSGGTDEQNKINKIKIKPVQVGYKFCLLLFLLQNVVLFRI